MVFCEILQKNTSIYGINCSECMVFRQEDKTHFPKHRKMIV